MNARGHMQVMECLCLRSAVGVISYRDKFFIEMLSTFDLNKTHSTAENAAKCKVSLSFYVVSVLWEKKPKLKKTIREKIVTRLTKKYE